MKKTTLLLFILISLKGIAQSNFPYEKLVYFKKGNQTYSHEHFKELKVKEKQVFVKSNPKKTEKLSWNQTYNQRGNIVSFTSARSKYQTIYQWHNDSLLSATIKLKNLDTAWYTLYQYNADHKLLSYEYFKKNSHTCNWKTTYAYNASGLKIKEIAFGKNGKFLSKIEYDYYEDGQKKETRIFDKKEKLVKIYSYACEAKGTIVEPKTEKLNYCLIKNKNEDGSFYEVIETHVKGKIKRQIYSYSPDSNMVKYELFKPNGQLRYSAKYTHNKQGKTTSYAHFNKRGFIKYSLHYTYFENGLLQNEHRYNRRNKLVFTTRHNYLFY